MDNQTNKEINDLFEGKIKFKPLTSGLGFHHTKNEMKSAAKKIHIPSSVELKIRENTLAQSLEKASQMILENEVLDRGDLTPFYSKSSTQTPEIPTPSKEIILASRFGDDADLVTRFYAWFLDLILVAAIFSFTVVMVCVMMANTSGDILRYLNNETVWLQLLPVSLFYYFFYFTFLEKSQTSTIGKYLLKINTVTLDGERKPDLYQTFSRSFITLFNVLTLGIGGLLDFQNKLTQTRVIQNQ